MAIIGFSAALAIDPGTATFTNLPELVMVSLPAFETTTVETSHLGLSNTYKTFTPGLTDGGVMTFECNYSKAAYTQLQTVLGKLKITTAIPPSGNDIRYRVTLPDEDAGGAGTAQVFTLTKMECSAEVESIMKIKGEVKVNSNITVA